MMTAIEAGDALALDSSERSFRHPLLQLMPYGDDAPRQLQMLQDAMAEAFSAHPSNADRIKCVLNLMQRIKLIHGLDDRSSLEIEILERVLSAHPSLEAFELLSIAQMNRFGIGFRKGHFIQPLLKRTTRSPYFRESTVVLHVPSEIKDVWTSAVSFMLAMDDEAHSSLSFEDAMAGIRLLRAHALYQDAVATSSTAEERLAFFSGVAVGLWNSLLMRARLSSSFDEKHEEEFGTQGQRLVLRRLEGELATENLDTAAPASTPSEAVAHTSAVVGHIVIAGSIPPSSNPEDAAALARYEVLRQPLPIAQNPDIARIDRLRETLSSEFPWADKAVEALLRDLRSRRLFGGTEMGTEPTLLVGLPGCGKSRLVRRIAEELSVPLCPLALSGMNDSMALVGTARGWATGQASPLISTMLNHGTASVLVLLDEIDKVSGGTNRSEPPTVALLNLLERENAKRWYDTFLQTPCDLSKLMFWATANSLKSIPKPLLSRFRVVLVPPPRREDLPALARSAARDICYEWGLPPGVAPDINIADVEDHSQSARDIKGTVRILLGQWAENNLGKKRLH